MIPPIWHAAPADPGLVATLARELGVTPITARLLVLRGLATPADARRFLAPSLSHLHDPMLLAGMREAVTRIEAAIAAGERIAVHGDYDVDGVTIYEFLPEAARQGRTQAVAPEGSMIQ